ncbi:MAG: magnesium chelatase subunit H [Halieaceae bacterium]|nr:magnesium chelatase subunit H [Halieaceae bacterium]
MKPKLTSAARADSSSDASMRVVLITLDAHVSSAFYRVIENLREEIPGFQLSVHAASDWDTCPSKVEHCREAIATANIVIVTMLFMEPHIKAVLPALEARRDECDAMVCCMSAGEVMKLTRMGRFDMGSEPTGAAALLKKLRGKPKQDGGSNSGAAQLKMLRRLPRILRFIPGTAQDVRIYFLTLQYWLAGSQVNLERMIKMLVQRYAAGPRQGLRDLAPAAAPVEYPEVGIYHPALVDRIAASLEQLPKARAGVSEGTVGVLLMRAYALAGNTAHYDAVIAALEAKNLTVVPAFASGLDARPAIDAFFMKDGKVTVDAVVSLTGFSLVGGPAYNDAQAAQEALQRLDVPYIAVQALEFQSIKSWAGSSLGLTPIEATMMVSIPELDGATGSMVFGGRPEIEVGDSREGHSDMQPHPERVDTLAARVTALVKLRRSARAERKVAVVLFNFPPNAGATGTAAHLSVWASLFNTLGEMQRSGYTVDMPESIDALRDAVLLGNASQHGVDANVHAKIAVDDHVRQETWLEEIEAQWGPAPGRHLTDGRSLFVLGAQFGNVLVSVQPSMGYEGDPMRLLFEGGHAPTHAFSAFYRYLRQEWQADAVLHFGTHGALEFMPGKQVGLSAACWPDRLIGNLPNFYLYAANNPSEGLIAKRRSAATLVSYMTPPLAQADLYRGLADLRDSIDLWRSRDDSLSADQLEHLIALIHTQAREAELTDLAEPWATADAEAAIDGLRLSLTELEESLIPFGMHVVGVPTIGEEREDLIRTLAKAGHDVDISDDALKALLSGTSIDSLLDHPDFTDVPAAERVEWLNMLANTGQQVAVDHELPALIRALDARFIPPVGGGDLLRSPDVLPTGRNIHGFDPFKLPSRFAVEEGARQANQLLQRHQDDGRSHPSAVALVLWGTDNLKTEGVAIAQALALMGARPHLDSYGRVSGAELIPLQELGRPRVDVVMTLSGIFRDLLPMQTHLLADAAWLAANADEPASENPIRANALAYQSQHGCDFETAALRVFSNAEGAYGSNVNMLIDSSAWEDEGEIAETFTRRKGHAYGRNGAVNAQTQLLTNLLGRVDLAYQNLDSVELGVTSVDHYFDTLGGISRTIGRERRDEDVPVYIADHTGGNERIRTLAEQVALETRTRVLNPKWYESMLEHGAEGVRAIESHVTNTMGWSATTGQVAPWVYQQLSETFILDEDMRRRLAAMNPTAVAKMANRLLEAQERSYWSPDDDCLDALRAAGEDLEDWIEGVGQEAVA